MLNDDRLPGEIRAEEKSIIADSAAEHTFPLLTMESLYVALERIGRHLLQDTGHALLNGFREAAEILLSVGSELTVPIHL